MRTAISTLAIAASLLGTSPVQADGTQFHGLLRSRDLTPFGFLRLDMRPALVASVQPEAWAIEAVLGYQNTWALSQNVERYLKSVEPAGRRDLSTHYADIMALPGEKYLVDLESANFDLTVHYRLSEHWTGYAIASFASYQGGFLDGFIEGFHRTFGLGQAGRPAANRNQANAIYSLKSVQYTSLDSPSDGGITDPTFGVRYSGRAPGQDWAYSIEGAVKIPIAGERAMLSTGRTDVGIQGSLQRFWNRDALYLDIAAVYYAGADGPVPEDAQVVPTLVFGYERVLGERTNLNLQGNVSTSIYSHRQTDLDELLGTKYQLTLGIRHRLERALLSFGITENLQNLNNTPDISAQLGVAYVPGG
jgi:Protein of unknown function (DUF3187)